MRALILFAAVVLALTSFSASGDEALNPRRRRVELSLLFQDDCWGMYQRDADLRRLSHEGQVEFRNKIRKILADGQRTPENGRKPFSEKDWEEVVDGLERYMTPVSSEIPSRVRQCLLEEGYEELTSLISAGRADATPASSTTRQANIRERWQTSATATLAGGIVFGLICLSAALARRRYLKNSMNK